VVRHGKEIDMSGLLRFAGSVRRDPAIEAWMREHAGELGTIAKRWFEAMRDCGDDVRELLHDGHPTACVADAAFADVNAFKAHVNVGFFRGAELADPDGLLQGTGKFMRHVKLRPGREVDAAALMKLIETAYTDMKGRLKACRIETMSRLGALLPRYAFVLNPHVDTKFTKCPRCETKTSLRKLSLVIHVEGSGLVIVGKTCRLCLRCDMLIAHKAEIDELLRTRVTASAPEYFVLGTTERRTYRRGLAGRATLDDVVAHMADFKSYWKVDVTPAGWYPKIP
jgi:hypothetical protein